MSSSTDLIYRMMVKGKSDYDYEMVEYNESYVETIKRKPKETINLKNQFFELWDYILNTTEYKDQYEMFCERFFKSTRLEYIDEYHERNGKLELSHFTYQLKQLTNDIKHRDFERVYNTMHDIEKIVTMTSGLLDRGNKGNFTKHKTYKALTKICGTPIFNSTLLKERTVCDKVKECFFSFVRSEKEFDMFIGHDTKKSITSNYNKLEIKLTRDNHSYFEKILNANVSIAISIKADTIQTSKDALDILNVIQNSNRKQHNSDLSDMYECIIASLHNCIIDKKDLNHLDEFTFKLHKHRKRMANELARRCPTECRNFLALKKL